MRVTTCALVLLLLVASGEAIDTRNTINDSAAAAHLLHLHANTRHMDALDVHTTSKTSLEAEAEARELVQQLRRNTPVQVDGVPGMMLEAKAEARLEPVTICVLVIVVIKLVLLIYRTVKKWRTLYNAPDVYRSLLGMHARDLNCRSSTDLYSTSLVLKKNGEAMDELSKGLFGERVSECMEGDPKALKAECLAFCKDRLTKSTTAVEGHAARFTQADIKLIESTGNDDAARGTACEETAKRLFDTTQQIDETLQQRKEEAIAACGASGTTNEDACAAVSDEKSAAECAVSMARKEYLQSITSVGPSAGRADPAPAVDPMADWDPLAIVDAVGNGKFAAIGIDNIYDVGHDAEQVVDPVNQDAQQVNEAMSANSARDAKIENLGATYVVVAEFGLQVLDSVVSSVLKHRAVKAMKGDLASTLNAMCTMRMSLAMKVAEIEKMQHYQETLYNEIIPLFPTKDWNLAYVNALRVLYAQYAGDGHFQAQATNPLWVDHRCTSFYDTSVKQPAEVDKRERHRSQWMQQCPGIMSRVAVLTRPDFPAFDVWHILWAPAGHKLQGVRMRRYQAALFRLQRLKLGELGERFPEEMRMLGCSPFDIMQVQYESERFFTKLPAPNSYRPPESDMDVCQTSDMAYCVATFHYARCHADALKKGIVRKSEMHLGHILKRHYAAFRSAHPWTTALPTATKDDPFTEQIKNDAEQVETDLYEFLSSQDHGYPANRRLDDDKKREFFPKHLQLHLLGELREWDKPRGNVDRRGLIQFGDVTFANNFQSVLPYCGVAITKKKGCHGRGVARWMASPSGAFRYQLTFGDLRWLASAMYSGPNTNDKVPPMGCTESEYPREPAPQQAAPPAYRPPALYTPNPAFFANPFAPLFWMQRGY